ncbi:unnamed protein product [Taenia asiatica]|uniref:Mediator of RNA polymerase II transcription subunit 20 n=1 Tax=Taenia asiatica TaxID=60517 RepID=A0A0R3WDQ2_TAEAS|nr:unnamed protein product [Taenia asiatica]
MPNRLPAMVQPQCIIPSCIAIKKDKRVGLREAQRLGTSLDDLNFFVGDKAIANEGFHCINLTSDLFFCTQWPIRRGSIEDRNLMQLYMEQMIFENSRVDPEDHHFLMAMLALVTSWGARKPRESSLTGTVVEFGGGVTQITPIAEGCGVGPTVKYILIAGRDNCFHSATPA